MGGLLLGLLLPFFLSMIIWCFMGLSLIATVFTVFLGEKTSIIFISSGDNPSIKERWLSWDDEWGYMADIWWRFIRTSFGNACSIYWRALEDCLESVWVRGASFTKEVEALGRALSILSIEVLALGFNSPFSTMLILKRNIDVWGF